MQIRILARIAIVGAAALVVAFFGYRHWQHTQRFVETHNAYVGANIVNVSSQVSGPVVRLHVSNNQMVQAGQLLLEIEPAPFAYAQAKARADLAMALQAVGQASAGVSAAAAVVSQREAELQQAQAQLKRTENLVAASFISRQGLDNSSTAEFAARSALALARANLEQATSTLGRRGAENARVQGAQALLAQATLDLANTRVMAPVRGKVANLSLRPGQAVQARASAFSVISDADYWVDANFKETELAGIEPGRSSSVVVDSYPDHIFHGVVDSLSGGSGTAFSLLPPQNATGNWVKVTQRVPVRVRIIDPDPNFPMHVGTTASVSIDIAGQSAVKAAR
jgi:membrane fusion protein (multidrug efflux system)